MNIPQGAHILSLPNEILRLIFLYLAQSDPVPFFLEHFRQIGNRLHKTTGSIGMPLGHARANFLTQIHSSQRRHFFEWLSVTGTCRRIRACAIAPFFSEKTLIMSPSTVELLRSGTYGCFSPDITNIILTNTQTIIIPSTSREPIVDNFSAYDCFPRLKTLALPLCIPYLSDLLEDSSRPAVSSKLKPVPAPIDIAGLDLNFIRLTLLVKNEARFGMPNRLRLNCLRSYLAQLRFRARRWQELTAIEQLEKKESHLAREIAATERAVGWRTRASTEQSQKDVSPTAFG
ncbi:uncharacterized protein KY384_008338 [Bacidia gigantensis]|uniref:uncharacterized protein n=1 Tax=Bacidia gigantensis TaxID=2732470 RepID=UPI001D039A5D|nr:uncharacterized protein KY384_008338 [Bacidia gigantensis]KAG8526909.1 hypothetical protein KY384_008338 [Bacidia gigantensis]